jgi:RimJ/RimL family protein N-acetyltransferase
MGFREQGIEPVNGFTGNGFILRPLTPADVALDYDAVMASREFLFHWEQNPPYPSEEFTVEENLKDLEKMYSAHRDGSRYTYTIMNVDETMALGCVYLIPNDDRMYLTAEVTSLDGTDLSTVDATVSFWVRPSTWGDGFERVALGAVLDWLHHEWPLNLPVIITNEHLIHQIATIEGLGLTRRFDYDREKDMYASRAYA